MSITLGIDLFTMAILINFILVGGLFLFYVSF